MTPIQCFASVLSQASSDLDITVKLTSKLIVHFRSKVGKLRDAGHSRV